MAKSEETAGQNFEPFTQACACRSLAANCRLARCNGQRAARKHAKKDKTAHPGTPLDEADAIMKSPGQSGVVSAHEGMISAKPMDVETKPPCYLGLKNYCTDFSKNRTSMATCASMAAAIRNCRNLQTVPSVCVKTQ